MEEKTAAAGEPNATRHESPHRARLAPVYGEEEQRWHVHHEVGRVDRAGAYLAAPVAQTAPANGFCTKTQGFLNRVRWFDSGRGHSLYRRRMMV